MAHHHTEVLDFYETAPWQVRFLLAQHPIEGIIFEPCVGDGAISNILKAKGFHVITADVDKSRKADIYGDATCEGIWIEAGPIDFVVTNPSFVASYLVLKKALKHSRRGVAMLQRTTWKEPTNDRGFFLQHHPPDRQLTMPRYSYKKTEKSSNDTATHDWFIWDNRITYPNGWHPHVIGFDAQSY